MKLTNNGKLLNAAAVLFCKDPEMHFPQCLLRLVGTGTQEIINECKKFHKPAPTYIERGNTFVVQFLLNNRTPKLSPLTDRQQEIIDILSSQKAASAANILQSLSAPPAERTLRDDLQS